MGSHCRLPSFTAMNTVRYICDITDVNTGEVYWSNIRADYKKHSDMPIHIAKDKAQAALESFLRGLDKGLSLSITITVRESENIDQSLPFQSAFT